jgi:MerR family transcriptional regulator, Zn(II)-responsive regulator of zntA
MRIGELAKQVGVTPETIRFYEKQGLLGISSSQRNTSNYRVYTEETVDRLKTIGAAKRLGFSLSEILELGRLWESGKLEHQQQIAVLQEKLDELAYKRLMLNQLEKVIDEKLVKLRTKRP